MSDKSDDEDDVHPQESKSGSHQTLGKYQVVQYIEKGSFGDVHLAKDMETGEQVAIKIVDKRKAIGSGSKRKKVVLDELNILKVKHPAIIELKDFFVTKDYLVLSMEYCEGGDLFTLTMKENPIAESRARYMFKQILEGIQHLHKLNIIHRDIKLENILLKDKGSDEIKITDFGMSRIISRVNLATTQCGTLEYTAPEVFKFQPYGRECDYWSLGILLYDLLTSVLPFNSVEEIVGCEHTPIPFDPVKWGHVSESAKELVRNLLVYNPDGRWTIEQALQCAWIKQLDGETPTTVYAVPDTSVDLAPTTTTTTSPSTTPTTPTKKRDVASPPSFGMSLRKRIKVKQPYDV
jgi:serine/threonine protein kinase